MPLNVTWLPMATPLDPAEEPPGSLDPLGTLNYAERLAEVLLPAFTVRMWRARLLTYAAVASTVADRTVILMGGREDRRLEARLAFERLVVAAIVRLADRDPANYARALPQLPGRDLGNAALRTGEPLTRANFLKMNDWWWPGRAAQWSRLNELILDSVSSPSYQGCASVRLRLGSSGGIGVDISFASLMEVGRQVGGESQWFSPRTRVTSG